MDCNHGSILDFCTGKYFNLEGDFISNFDDLWQSCKGCSLKIFFDLKKIYKENIIREIYHGILLFQKEKDNNY